MHLYNKKEFSLLIQLISIFLNIAGSGGKLNLLNQHIRRTFYLISGRFQTWSRRRVFVH
jgi:hypothetical protein